ncbi:hypothetical protein GEMRC1_003292 [Eukaryota sp. GEM-RC1]
MLDVYGLGQLISVQLFNKLSSFLLNKSALAKDTSSFGVATFRFDLLNRSIVFLSREPFRRLILQNVEVKPSKSLLKLLFLELPLSLVVSFLLLFFFTFGSEDSILQQNSSALLIVVISSLLECSSEPFYNLLLTSEHNFSVSNLFLSLSFLVKTFASMACFLFNFSVAMSYAVGYLFRSLFLLCSYSVAVLLRVEFTNSNLTGEEYQYLKIYSKQTVLKYILTEAENNVLFFLLSDHQLGLYSFAKD